MIRKPEPDGRIQTENRVSELAGEGNQYIEVCSAIAYMVLKFGSFMKTEEWLILRHFPETRGKGRTKWWDDNFDKYFELSDYPEGKVRLRQDAYN